MGSRCSILRPGLVEYREALEFQRRIAEGVRAGGEEALILLEHPPTYTIGARGDERHILAPIEHLQATGASVVRTDRGGDVTFHGPGQIVGYPILNLRARGLGAVAYVRTLEQLLIDTLARFGIESQRAPGRPGVWTTGGKVAAIGVRISGGTSTHGFALNVAPDLGWFANIVPCGITGAGVTSMEHLCGRALEIDGVMDTLADEFARAFSVDYKDKASRNTQVEVPVGR